ncbi:MAG: MFS transporter [Alphaproteobacteria bacterium]|nr:MFS transporter [Alphaproteobacteria bacterium]
MIHSWKKSILAFWDRRIFSIFFFGFSSGLPFLLTLSTLTIWLKESGVNNTTIGLFVLVTIPYTLKFLWGPMVDRVKLPFLSKPFGQRRSWALIAQISLIFFLFGLGSTHPENHIIETAFWAFGVALCSAIQDIVLEAYRIEIIDEDQTGAAASSTYLGYRMGMLMSGAGALYLATIFSWQTAYEVMAILIGIGVLTTLFSPSPKTLIFSPAPHLSLKDRAPHTRFWKWIQSTYGPPLNELLRTYDWRVVLAFIFFYKVGDTTLNVMNTPFLVELGYSKLEIAHVAKLFGISAMIVGGFMGGLFLNRFGILSSLMLCAILQILSSLMFVIQALVGYNLDVLIITIGVENLTCGLGAAAFIAYLSSLCSVPYTATHFALLSSFGSMARVALSVGAGILADSLPWHLFFTVTAAACLPCLFLLIVASHHFHYSPSFLRPAPQT